MTFFKEKEQNFCLFWRSVLMFTDCCKLPVSTWSVWMKLFSTHNQFIMYLLLMKDSLKIQYLGHVSRRHELTKKVMPYLSKDCLWWHQGKKIVFRVVNSSEKDKLVTKLDVLISMLWSSWRLSWRRSEQTDQNVKFCNQLVLFRTIYYSKDNCLHGVTTHILYLSFFTVQSYKSYL